LRSGQRGNRQKRNRKKIGVREVYEDDLKGGVAVETKTKTGVLG